MQSRQDCVLWFQLSALTACCSSTRIMCTQNTDISFDCRGTLLYAIYEQYLCRLHTLPFLSPSLGGAQKSLSFFWLLAHVSMDRYANATNLILKMPPALLHTLSWYVHFHTCVFCNYGRITNGLLSLYTPTLTHKLKINLNCMS